jgi:multidrug efflux pump subunit AcrB
MVREMKVRNGDGDMVPLGSVVNIRGIAGPLTVTRYNMFPSAPITGVAKPGASTGDVIAGMEALADKSLPRNMAYEWTENSATCSRTRSVPSSWVCCWCFSCCRGCTKAGRCRLP